jgi:hypothetical protein
MILLIVAELINQLISLHCRVKPQTIKLSNMKICWFRQAKILFIRKISKAYHLIINRVVYLESIYSPGFFEFFKQLKLISYFLTQLHLYM